MSSTTGGSADDPPGGFFSHPRLLRTPFGRMLQQLNINPTIPSLDDPLSNAESTNHNVANTVVSADPPTMVHAIVPEVVVSLPRVTESPPPPRYQRPDPDASLSSDPLSAYSPYTREVIIQGGDQSVCPRSLSVADTIEAAEEALYDADLSPGGSLLEGRPVPTEIVTPGPSASFSPPPTPPSPTGPMPPPTVTFGAAEVYVRYQSSSSEILSELVVRGDFHGVAHPYLRGFIGPDRSTQHSHKNFYAVRRGWNPGIYTSWGDAWARIADFRSLSGSSPEFAGASTYDAAVRYLGWDPRLCPPRGPFPPLPTVPYTQGPWPRPVAAFSPGAPSPALVASPVPSDTTSLARRLESALLGASVPPDTVANVVRSLNAAPGVASPARPLGAVGLGGSGFTETPSGKLRREQKGFPEYPATAFTGEHFDQFYEAVRNILHMPHWHLQDGSTIPRHTSTPDNEHDRLVSQQLHYHLVIAIQGKRNPVALGVLSELQSEDAYGDGIVLLERLRAIAYPTTTSSFFHDLDTWHRLSHRNKEDLTTFYRRAKEARARLQTHKYEVTILQFCVRFYYLVVKGLYGHAMRTLEEEFKCNRLDLFHMSTQELFISMHQEFREHCYKSRSTMEVMDGKSSSNQVIKGRRVTSGESDGDDDFTPVGPSLTSAEAKQQHKEYKCLMCKIFRKGNKKGGCGIHPTWKCPLLKECGFTIDYDYTKDTVLNPEGRPSFFPAGCCSSSGSAKIPSVAGRRAQDSAPPVSPAPVVETVGSDTASSTCKLLGPSRLPCDVLSLTSCPVPQSDFDNADDWSEAPSEGSDGFAEHWILGSRGSDSNLLLDESPIFPVDSPSFVCRRSIPPSSPSPSRSLLCPDSGATADMFWDRALFVDDEYEPVSHQFVEMGDGRRVPIVGKGTVQFDLGGHSVRLADCYHVPQLDVHLLSIRVHRRRGAGCSFLADGQGMSLTFPSFVVSVDDDADPLIPIRPCSATPTLAYSDDHGSVLYGRACRAVGRRVATRAQTQAKSSPSASPTLPSCYVADTGVGKQRRHTPFELHRLFRNRTVGDFTLLREVGSGVQVVDAQESVPTVGDFTTIDQRRRGPSRRRERSKLDLVGMDIGYGSGTSPGGFNYCLTLVDSATRMVFCYGLQRLTGGDLQDAFWRFLIDAGGIPKTVQCDFDSRFLGGSMAGFLKSLRIVVRSAAPRRQSSNGLVERTWRTGVRMARSFLAEAKLPRSFWYWALHESFHRMNLLPV